jgi:hypothetical protein
MRRRHHCLRLTMMNLLPLYMLSPAKGWVSTHVILQRHGTFPILVAIAMVVLRCLALVMGVLGLVNMTRDRREVPS